MVLLVSNASADVKFGSHVAPAEISVDVNVTSDTTSTAQSVSIWTQIYQVLEDLTLYMMDDDNVCQLVVDDNSSFANPEINHRLYITEYTYDEYLDNGVYYWKVRCMTNDRWSYWSDVWRFNKTGDYSIYFDWTIV